MSTPRMAEHSQVKVEPPFNPDAAMAMSETKQVAVGKQVSICRCWQSTKHPFCDGSHSAYNTKIGDQIGPLKVKAVESEDA